jgi:CO/xanthine dehydrogenase Mo-binding subunit
LHGLDQNTSGAGLVSEQSAAGLKQACRPRLASRRNHPVNPVAIGADFGGELSPGRAALLRLRSARSGPVKMVMEYQEEFVAGAGTAIVHVKTGVKRDGTIVAHDGVILDGACNGLRPSAVSPAPRGHATAPNARIVVKRVYTNNIPGGQMRAPGDLRIFAAESQIDCVARRQADPGFRLGTSSKTRKR